MLCTDDQCSDCGFCQDSLNSGIPKPSLANTTALAPEMPPVLLGQPSLAGESGPVSNQESALKSAVGLVRLAIEWSEAQDDRLIDLMSAQPGAWEQTDARWPQIAAQLPGSGPDGRRPSAAEAALRWANMQARDARPLLPHTP